MARVVAAVAVAAAAVVGSGGAAVRVDGYYWCLNLEQSQSGYLSRGSRACVI